MKINPYRKFIYLGAGSPSASHSMINGLSFSFVCSATWNSSSSVGGSLIILGGEWTRKDDIMELLCKQLFKKKRLVDIK